MCIRDSIMKNMQLVRSSSLKKFEGIASVVRNASFKKGWLHLAVQCLFAIIIVTSFILIIIMTLPKRPYGEQHPIPANRCYSKSCIVICDQVPYFDDYEEDIVYTVSQLRESCWGIYLALVNPMFHNGTIGTHWIPRLRLPIFELSINGGNLSHLRPRAFLSKFMAHIGILVLCNMNIKSWATDSFVGLTHLRELVIKNCTLARISESVFRSVQNTLQSLTIMHCKQWNPLNITGTINLPNVTAVDFSNNLFNNILDKNSFAGLKNCKMLYLNSCNISVIGEGTFDSLNSIETLFLNDNKLVTIPADLFRNVLQLTNPKPRINLHDNNWYCDCSETNIRKLVKSESLLTHPICNKPDNFAGKTFYEIVSECDSNTNNSRQTVTTAGIPVYQSSTDFIYVNKGCYNNNETSSSRAIELLSPIDNHQCPPISIQREELRTIAGSRSRDSVITKNNWIQFSFFLDANSSIIQTVNVVERDYGVLWYQSTCPNEVYCINVVEGPFKILNVDTAADYVFCPIISTSGTIVDEHCITYNLNNLFKSDLQSTLQIIVFIATAAVCLLMGALCVYALVRKHPGLLRGSNRILFVKHKNVDALVLPPEVPPRNNLPKYTFSPELSDEKIFIVSTDSLDNRKLNRNFSVYSSKNYEPSYISALQPSEVQLSEWRNKNNLKNEVKSELSVYSWLCNADTHLYTDLIDTDTIYESLK